MQRIDFRTEYTVVSVISFGITFFVFLSLQEAVLLVDEIPRFLTNFLVSLGLYILIFRTLMLLYNRYLWKYIGYRHIDVSGYWRYRSYKSTTQTNTEGFAYISQDMYRVEISGFNIGSSGDKKAIAMWKTDNVIISRGELIYDYELFAERPHRASRVVRSKVSLNLYGSPPSEMPGIYIDLVVASEEETITSNLVGSIVFTRCKYEDLSNATMEIFDRMMVERRGSTKPVAVRISDED